MNKYFHRDTGFLCFEQGKIDQALDEFDQALKADPQDASTHFGSGLCRYAKGEFDKAIEAFKKTLEINPRHRQADYQLGLCHYQKKEFPQALVYFKRTVKLDPENKYVYCQLGQSYLEEKKYDLALEALKKYVKLNPEASSAHQVLGAAYLEQGSLDKAADEFDQALKVNPQDAGTRFYLGLCCYAKGEFDKAIEAFKKTLEIAPRHLRADYQLGLCHLQKKEFSKAVVHFKQALTLDPQNKQAYDQLNQVYLQQKRYDLALETLKKNAELNPGTSAHKYFHRDAGFLYFEQGQIDKALDEFDQALKADPQDASTHFGSGLCWYAKGEFDKAIEAFKKTLEIDPRHPQADYQLGLCYLRKKEFSEALVHFKRVLKLDPESKQAYYQLGQAYLEQKQYDLALEALKKNVKLNPEVSSAHQVLGVAYLEQGRTDKAMDEFNRALKADPQDAGPHFYLGLCCYAKGEFDKAVEAFKKTLKKDPQHLQVDYHLGLCHLQKKEFSKAVVHFKQALTLDPQNKQAYDQLNQVYLQQKRYDLALETLKKNAELNPGTSAHKYFHRDAGFLYFEQGQIDKATDEFGQALKADPQDASTHFGTGLCCYAKGEFDKAIEEFKKTLKKDPQHLQVDYHLGLCHYQKKEFSEALVHFKRVLKLDPESKQAYYQLGRVYLEQKQYDLALETLKKNVKLNPEVSSAHQVLGVLYLERGLYNLAEVAFEKAVLLDTNNLFARQMLTYSYRKQGKLGLAIHESMKAVNLSLESRKSDRKPLGFKVKIVRMPDFSEKTEDRPQELHYTLLPPLALGQIVAYLRAHAVEIDQDDLNINIHYDKHHSRTPAEGLDTTVFFDENKILKYVSGAEDQGIEAILEEVAEKSRLCDYGVILFSLREIYANASCFLFALSLARFLKKKFNPTLILGGSGQSIDLLSKYDCRDIDYIIYHENETVLLELLLALKDQDKLSKFMDSRMKTGGKVVSTELTDAHPPLKPDFSGLPMDKYRYSGFTHDLDGSCEILEEFDKSGTLLLPFKFIRGCPHECAFCTMSNNKIMFVLDPATVALYLKELQEEHHPTGFFFLSDTFNISKQYVNELCDEIIKNKTKILWSDCARADNLDQETLFKMRQAGCMRLIFGIETASTRLLKYVRKGISVKKLEDTLKWSDEAGIWTGVEIICGLPHEQERDIEETIAFLNKNKKYIDTLYINQFDLRDGSMLLSQAKDLGIENISRIDQYATEEFSNFHKYSYDEIGGLRWPDKRKQIVHSYKKLLDNTEGNDFFSYELEHLLFFLYHKFGDKQKVRQMYDEIALKKTALKKQKTDHSNPCP